MKFPWSFFLSMLLFSILLSLFGSFILNIIQKDDYFTITLTINTIWNSFLISLIISIVIMIVEGLDNFMNDYNDLIDKHNNLCEEVDTITNHSNKFVAEYNKLEQRFNEYISEDEYVKIYYKGELVDLNYK